MTILFLILFALIPTTQAGAAKSCLTYERNLITLNGTIERKTLPGPPNYESVAKGDQPEVIWVLHLVKPICVTATGDWEEEKNVVEVQLVFPESRQYGRYESLVSQRVSVSGKLFHAHTGHHHTKVLLTVTGMRKRIRGRSPRISNAI